MKTSELQGALLDYWVARAEGAMVKPGFCGMVVRRGEGLPNIFLRDWKPSTNWQIGGPIIERERIRLSFDVAGWDAQMPCNDWIYAAPSMLVAAMRAYVASKFGSDVPDDQGQA